MQRATLGATIGIGMGISLVTVGVLLTTAWCLAMYFPLLVPVTTGAAGFAVGHHLDKGHKPAKRLWLAIAGL